MADSTRRRWRLPGAHEKEAEALLGRVLELDRARGVDPIQGRKADEAMMALCQFFKDRRGTLAAATQKRILETLRSMNLRPYWNYCREHLLDAGLEF